ncbi:hypothetical protein [Streptomyces sioyaensis]|uniref:hypothetical protein n=1 Tax=Streptomyces sioyaensis TaxID=67364 RepID=UPI0037994E4F
MRPRTSQACADIGLTLSHTGSRAAAVLAEWTAAGAWSADDARRVGAMIAADNARRVYGLPDG